MALGENEVGADAIVDPDTGSVATAGSPGRVYLDNRFEIDPQRPIPQLDSPGGAAYAAVDVNASNRLLYALVLDGRVPVRARAMKSLRTTNSDLFVRPVQWGTVDWPGAKQRRFALMCTHPGGARLVDVEGQPFEPIQASRLVSNYARPLVVALRAMAEARVGHRAIRLTNLFRCSGDRSLVLGECFSTPPGSHQPIVYEPIERALAHPMGRARVR